MNERVISVGDVLGGYVLKNHLKPINYFSQVVVCQVILITMVYSHRDAYPCQGLMQASGRSCWLA